MRCPRCRQENPPQAKYCQECAAPLALACPRCGTSIPAAAKFCPECAQPVSGRPAAPPTLSSPEAYTPKHLAEKILTSRGALEGERKQVTVLFADVSGFTALSERSDPEVVHDLMRRAFELMLAEVHRYEGTVNQFLGDGIMALFGAPIAHEDHGRRAVHAALGIRRALEAWADELQRQGGITFVARQGLNTGLVVVGSIGSDLRMDYTAVGDTTNVAARLVQSAGPGRIVISAATHRLVDGYFYTRPLGDLALKGKAESVAAWEMIDARSPRTRLEVEAERGLTPFVGRDRELTLLGEAFERARAGQGQVVFVAGEPGIGKSRVLLEFRRRLGDEATWVEGHCMSFGRSIAFHPLVDLLKRTFRIEESDPEAAIVRKIERGALRLGEDLRSTVPYLRYLLSVDPGDPAVGRMEPPQRKGEIFEAVRRLTLRAAEVHPQVCVFEDLHWMDGTTEDYLAFVHDSVATSRILLVVTYRPGYAHRLGERSYHTRIVLHALPEAQSVEMAGAVLGTGDLPPELAALIVRKAEGNPFFVEEVVRSLQEVGVIRQAGERWVLAKRLDEVVIPDTIQDVIMARIDRLDEDSKKTLQLASVIGREFTGRLLERIGDIRGRTEEFLRELKALELIYEKRVFPELAYMFKHALTHEVAYGSLLVQRRKALHRMIGLAIEELYPDRLAEQYEVLAYHFTKAEEWPKALSYLRQAAAKAAGRSAHREAVAHLEEALAVLGHLPEARETTEAVIDVRCDLRNSLAPLGEYGQIHDYLVEAEAAAQRLGDARRQARVAAYMTNCLWATVDHERAVLSGRRVLAIAEDLEDLGLQVAANLMTAWPYHDLADYRQATALLRWNVAALGGERRVQRFGLPTLPSVESRGLLAWCLGWQGQFAEALVLVGEAADVAREADHAQTLAGAANYAGLVHAMRGDVQAAVSALEDTITRRQALHARAPAPLAFLGWAYALAGRVAEALPLFEESLELAAAMKFLPCNSVWITWWGEACVAAGRLEEAAQHGRRAREIARTQNERGYEAHALRLLGEVAARRNPAGLEAAETHYREAMSLAEPLGLRPLVARCHLGLGRLWRRSGDGARAETHLATALAAFRAMDMPSWRDEAERALGE